jgi:adenosyl cobinamide kinase/adenosyl cobinamide phosphate guanylyltransferase
MLMMLIHKENHTYCSTKHSLVFVGKEIGLEVNPDQTERQFVSLDQNAG